MANMLVKDQVDKERIKQIVLSKLGVELSSMELLDINIDEIEQTIKNYCNIDVIPKALTFTFVNMVCDLHTYNSQVLQDNKSSDEELDIDVSPSGINSVRVGNATISFGSGSDTNSRNRALRSHDVDLDQLVLNYKSQLNKFRKMVW